MPDHEFEKKIQEKMGELRLSPSAPVWDRVEQRLNKKDKRRRGLLWIPFSFAAAVAIFLLINHSGKPVDKPADAARQVTEAKSYPQVDRQIKENIDTARVHEEDGVTRDPLRNIDTVTGPAPVPGTKTRLLAIDIEKPSTTASRSTKQNPSIVTAKSAADLRPNEESKLARDNGHDDQSGITPVDGSKGEMATERALIPSRVTARPVNIQRIYISREMVMPDFKPTEMKRAARKTPPPLEFGLTASLGRSHITNGAFSQLFSNAMELSNVADRSPANFTSAGPGPAAPVLIRPSRLKASAGFTAGGYVKKQLTPAIWLSTGLNYKLYSTVNTVGGFIDTFRIQNNSTSAVVLDHVYNTGNANRHTNYFHFIEIPVTAEGRLLNGRLPLTWNAGASFSRLIASNALHYDSRYRVYHKQNNLLQKNYLNLNAAITTKIFLSSRNPVAVGPEFSYSVSNLLQTKNGNAKHFMFVGLKTYIPIN